MLPFLQNSSSVRISLCTPWCVMMWSISRHPYLFLGQHWKQIKCCGIDVGHSSRWEGVFAPWNLSIHISSPSKPFKEHTPHLTFWRLLFRRGGTSARRGVNSEARLGGDDFTGSISSLDLLLRVVGVVLNVACFKTCTPLAPLLASASVSSLVFDWYLETSSVGRWSVIRFSGFQSVGLSSSSNLTWKERARVSFGSPVLLIQCSQYFGINRD